MPNTTSDEDTDHCYLLTDGSCKCGDGYQPSTTTAGVKTGACEPICTGLALPIGTGNNECWEQVAGAGLPSECGVLDTDSGNDKCVCDSGDNPPWFPSYLIASVHSAG